MVKILWMSAFIASLLALCLHPLGCKHFGVMAVVCILAVISFGVYIALIILLFGGPFYL